MEAIKPNVDGDWLVVVNPNAGKRKGERNWGKIARSLEDANISFVSVFTQRKFQAIQLTKKHIEKKYCKIIVVGGDGTLNEVINGIFLQNKYPVEKIIVGMIPVGTGNDWCRMYNIPADYNEATKLIAEQNTFVQDVGLVHYYEDNMLRKRYFVNMVGMGYDALVTKKTNKQKEAGKSNPLSYYFNLVTSLFHYSPITTKIDVDGKKIKVRAFSISTGINHYNGGGMKQLPEAIPNDGIMDMTVIRNLGKIMVIRSINKLYDGSFVKMPQVSTHKGKRITISSKGKRKLMLEADGESLGHSPFSINIIPRAVTFIVPKVVNGKYAEYAQKQKISAV
ncbi:MAG: diacylglycerol kinase family protein [Bacteroidota bacterium]|nr:diacylglycerol kinase family protein [Bacteroidota bacterium]